MLVIRKEQLAAFETAAIVRFARSRLPLMKRAWPERCEACSDRELLGVLQKGVETARAHGIVGDVSMTAFLHLLFRAGFDFLEGPEHAWVREVLASPDLLPAEKVRYIERRLTASGPLRD
jgi:hypothetical protein